MKFQNDTVGNCTVSRTGLYYQFTCRCERVSDLICRLKLRCAGQTLDLGVLIPHEDSLTLEKRLSAKSVPVGEPDFIVVTAEQVEQTPNRFVPVRQAKPLDCLQMLKNARFARRGDAVGLIFDN